MTIALKIEMRLWRKMRGSLPGRSRTIGPAVDASMRASAARRLLSKVFDVHVAALALLFVCMASSSVLSAMKVVPLEDLLKQGGSAEVTIEKMGIMPGQRALGINFFHLKPGSVYSVWVVDESSGAKSKLGVDGNHFRTDSMGNGRYIATAMEYEMDRWRYIVICRHPDGDPENTEGMVEEMRGDFRYGWRY